MRLVTFFTRPNCPLCDEARRSLARSGISFEEVDISRIPALKEKYGTSVPVIEADGVVVFEGGMNPQALPSLLAETSG